MHFLHICIGAQYLLNHIWEIWRFAPNWSAIQLPGLESPKKIIDSQSTPWLNFWSRVRGMKSSSFFGYLREFAVRRFIEEVPVVEKKCDRDAHSMQCLTPLSMQWLSCSLILEAEKSHLIVSSSTCFGSLFYRFSEKLGHSNNMIGRFIAGVW